MIVCGNQHVICSTNTGSGYSF